MSAKKSTPPPKRRTVEVSAAAQSAAQALADRYPRMSKRAIVESVLEWLAEQDPTLQAMILGQVPDAFAPSFARTLLEAMANKPEGDTGVAGEIKPASLGNAARAKQNRDTGGKGE